MHYRSQETTPNFTLLFTADFIDTPFLLMHLLFGTHCLYTFLLHLHMLHSNPLSRPFVLYPDFVLIFLCTLLPSSSCMFFYVWGAHFKGCRQPQCVPFLLADKIQFSSVQFRQKFSFYSILCLWHKHHLQSSETEYLQILSWTIMQATVMHCSLI